MLAPASPPLSIGLALALALAPPAQEEAAAPLEHWVWHAEATGDDAHVSFRYVLELDDVPATAVLRAAADNRLELSIDGELVCEHGEWAYAVEIDVAEHLRAGPNELVFWCRNDGGPAGLRAALELAFADGRREHVVTGPDWQVARLADPEDDREPIWESAHDLGLVGVEPWGEPEPARPPGPRTTPADEIDVPDGFEVELVYPVPGRQGSWVSLTFDERGRALASDQWGALYRFDPRSGEPAERLDVELGSAQGLTFAFGALYAVVNSSGDWRSGLYRLRDTTGDDRFDEVRCLRAFDGHGEHGPHAVVPGPDGATLWVLAGNHTALPEPLDASRVPRVWAEDQLLPREPDPNGHAVGVRAPGGWVARTDPDGERWELWACGMRNAYDLAFDARGEPFTFDSDMEWDVGLPWYRPARVLQLASGADFGWRHGSGKWPVHVPDSLPGVLDVGLASPTGVVRSDALAFPPAWRSALYVADWAYGTIYAVTLEPDGASHRARAEPFVRARGLPVTDLAVGPQGRLWFAVGGRGTSSALYAVCATVEPELAGDRDSERGFVDEAALLRRRLDARHGDTIGSLDEIWRGLDHADRFVRHAARVALESADPSRWRERALSEERPRAAATALVALARVAPGSAAAVKARALALCARHGPSLDRLRALELALIRGELELSVDEAADLRAAFPSGDDALDRELAKLLVHARAIAPEALLERIDAARTQEEALTYAWLARVVDRGWTERTRAAFARFVERAERELEGGHSLARYLAVMREAVFGDEPDAARIVEATFERESSEARARTFQSAWRVSDLAGHVPALSSERSFERGARVFREARCGDCHRIAGAGGADGPDLTGAGQRFRPHDLLDALIEPSRVVSDQYRDTELWLTDGTLVVGRLVGQDGPWLEIHERGSSTTLEVHAGDVALRRAHPLSSMPDGLLDTFTREEILDLCAYVLAGGQADDPAFSDAD